VIRFKRIIEDNKEVVMARARESLICLESSPYCHCNSRCVRRALLCGEDPYTGHFLVDRYLAGEVMSKAEWASLSELIEKWRLRLHDISLFMCCMTKYLAQRADI
jgi:hypothetical protein